MKRNCQFSQVTTGLLKSDLSQPVICCKLLTNLLQVDCQNLLQLLILKDPLQLDEIAKFAATC